MKIKLANTPSIQEGVEVTNVSQSFFIHGEHSTVDEPLRPVSKIQMNTDNTKTSDFKKYVDFFKKGDVSTIEVYNDRGDDLIATLHGSSVESVSQNIQHDNANIYIAINI